MLPLRSTCALNVVEEPGPGGDVECAAWLREECYVAWLLDPASARERKRAHAADGKRVECTPCIIEARVEFV